jgi:ectoine hydroxylase-related dioxygenase (phytanoyl-CoA dioxygenase family)
VRELGAPTGAMDVTKYPKLPVEIDFNAWEDGEMGTTTSSGEVARPPLPPVRLDVEISDEQVAFFHENGYVDIGRVSPDEELAWIRDVYDQFFEQCIGGVPGAYLEPSRPYGAERLGKDSPLSQVLLPEALVPELRESNFHRNGRAASSRLMGIPEAELGSWAHMITKPAGNGDIAPWHQDEAYWEIELEYQAVGVWMPLDDADVDNGCLWFVPGSHRGDVLPHKHIDDNPQIHSIVVTEPIDMNLAVPVPLAAGHATIHHPRTLHHSGPNRTDRRRRAYATEFQTPPTVRDVPADRPWVLETRAAEAEYLRSLSS